MSPMYYSTHPFALLLDCGLGSDPDYQGPCTGTAGTSSPDYLSASAKSSLASGKGEILAIGAALVLLAAVLVLLRMIRKPLGVRTSPSESDDLDGYVCRKCGSDDISGASVDLVTCGACGFAGNADSSPIPALAEGQGYCFSCAMTYDVEDGCPCGCSSLADDSAESFDGVCRECGAVGDPDDEFCMTCGAGLDGYAMDQKYRDELAGAAGDEVVTCDKCGTLFTPDEGSWVGDTCSACNAAYDEAHALDDVDAGPDDEEAAHGNPDGIGADDEGLRA